MLTKFYTSPLVRNASPIRCFGERVDDDAGIWGGFFDDNGLVAQPVRTKHPRAPRHLAARTSSGESPIKKPESTKQLST
jgi:hypothetical protein